MFILGSLIYLGHLNKMASITLLTSNNTGAESLTIINGNFVALNNGEAGGNMNTSVYDPAGIDEQLVGLTHTQTLTNKTLTAPVIATVTNSGTLTLPSSTDTLVGRATTDTLTNKTITTPTITKPVMSATNPTAQTYTPSISGTATLDLSLSNQHFIQMPAGNITIALTNDTNNQNFLISIKQDSGGSRTVTWFSGILWAGGSPPTLTTTASKTDLLGFIRTGSGAYIGLVVGQNI